MPEKVRVSQPVQVVVFSGSYVNLYLADLQMRLDNYWEDFKLAFIQDKEAFILFRERAQRQALDSALAVEPGNSAAAARKADMERSRTPRRQL